MTSDRILSKDDVCALIGVTEMTIRTWERENLFPRRFKLSPRGSRVGWSENSVQAWIQERVTANCETA